MRDRDLELCERFRAGDDDALRALVSRHAGAMRARVLRWVPRAVLRRISVADVLQEALLVASRRRADFQGNARESFRNWILAIVGLKAREAVRFHAGTAKRAANREVSRGQRRSTQQYAAEDASPSEVAVQAEMRDFCHRVMETLSEDDRCILMLAFREHLTLGAAAERMGRSREAAKKLYGRALVRFRRAYEQMEEPHRG